MAETKAKATTIPDPTAGEEPTTEGAFSEDGVDLTLIRSMLELSPGERLRMVQDLLDAVGILRRRVADDP